MANGPDFEARVSALETQMQQVAADAAAARHLAAANDRDLSSLSVKVDAHRAAINALGVQTAARFDKLESDMNAGFTEVRSKLDQTAAGLQQIVTLLTDGGPVAQYTVSPRARNGRAPARSARGRAVRFLPAGS